MAIDRDIEVTPEFTFSTVQFDSEAANVIIASLLTVFILINIGSAVSKLIYFTRRTSFDYRSWLRAFIFANSDDPIRIISWISHNYFYKSKTWNRYRNKLKLQRLIVPLLARAFILIVSIASVAVSVPGEKKLNGCQKGDYRIKLDNTVDEKADQLRTACIDVPMNTRLGKVRSVVSYCNCPFFFTTADVDFSTKSRVVSVAFSELGSLATLIYSKELGAGHEFYIQWNDIKRRDIFFYSDLSQVDPRKHLEIAVRAIRLETRLDCNELFEPSPVLGWPKSLAVELDCTFDSSTMISPIEQYIRNALTWERLEPEDKEARFIVNMTDPAMATRERTVECPIDVTVTRPIVNILPLFLMLLLWIVVNLIVSFATSKHGNALDAGFHITKEALGHDCTSNPLEENVERKEVTELELRKWRCGPAGAHVGFIGRDGDVPVEDFDESTIVCGCSQVAVELEAAASLTEVPFAPPGLETSSHVDITQQQQFGPTPFAAPAGAGTPFNSSVDGSQVSEQAAWRASGPTSASHFGMRPPPPSGF